MDVSDLQELKAETDRRMHGAVEHVRQELAGVRTGRATPALLDPVQVEAYGSTVPLNQVASLSVPDPTLIVAQPFDPSLTGAIERAIQKANLGLNPASDGKVLRIPIPMLTDERRKEMSRIVHKYAEDGRNAVRQVRREANDHLKKLLKKHELGEDDEHRALDDVQKLTDKHVGELNAMQEKKDAALLGDKH